MITLLTILHVSVCIFLIAIVLLQHGKGADMGASFGGGSSQTVFGSDGPLPLLNKITTGGAIVFMVTSVALAYNSAHVSKGSVMKGVRTAPISQPAVNTAPVEVPLPSSDQATQGDTSNPFPDEAMSSSHNDKAATKAPSTDKTK
jgi:preprotein translocase subunit SecG